MRIFVIILLLSSLFSQKVNADVDVMDLMENPLAADRSCAGFCITGICIWLKCTLFGCSTKTSLKIRHRQADLVVSSYPELGENPWNEFRSVYGSFQKSTADRISGWIGGIVEPGSGEISNDVQFREVDVVGSPWQWSRFSDDYFCGSNATPFVPHYSSAFDFREWRLGTIDTYLAVFNWEAIGTPILNEWGYVYPRIGFIRNLNPARANAVLSLRGGHIATRGFEGHVSNGAMGTPSSNQRFFSTPGPVTADGSNDNVWQMIWPKRDSKCYVFDDKADQAGATDESWQTDRWDDDKSSSVYNLWRPYECCKKKGQFFIVSIPIGPICLN